MQKKLFLMGMFSPAMILAAMVIAVLTFGVVVMGCEGPAGPAGPAGADGNDGISIIWKGTLAAAPANPVTNWAYYNTADKKAYIYDGTTWQILAVDGRDAFTFTTPATYRAMAGLAGGTITATSNSSVFISDRTVTLNAFKIAKYETTYQLWKEVYDWATANGYTIANPGREGHGTNGTGTAGTAAERATRPVTEINWRDAIVWCNAYSELSGKEAVYYTDDTYTTLLKVSTNDSGTTTVADGAKMKPGANGYRLPTEAEWEYAARGGTQSPTTPWTYTYAGSSNVDDVAWYNVNAGSTVGSSNAEYGAHPVGDRKAANSAGLYDMSGNVWEWCWDWYGSISDTTPDTGTVSGAARVIRGGGWNDYAIYCGVSRRNGVDPYDWGDFIGFRVVCP